MFPAGCYPKPGLLVPSVSFDPATITDLALFLQYDATHCSPAVAGTAVDSVSASYGTTRTASQSGSARPKFRASGLEYDGASSQYMNLSSGLALTGEFTSYHVFNSPAGADCFAVGSVLGLSLVGLAGAAVGVIDDAGTFLSLGTGLSGMLLVRLSRGAGDVTIKATGGLSLDGFLETLTFDSIGASGGNAVYSGSTANRSLCDIVKIGDNTGTQENTDTLAWLFATYAATLS